MQGQVTDASGWPLETGEGKATDCPLEPPERHAALLTSHPQPGGRALDSDPQNCEMTGLSCLRTLHPWSRVTAAMEN